MYNYPNKKKINERKVVEVNANTSRGMVFEEEITRANEYYNTQGIANIHKKPTPIKIMKVVNYKEGVYKKTKITEAVFEKRSTTDYNGVYRGFYIDFEAKETINKSFNTKSNLHSHQIEHLVSVQKHGGISFVIINMKYYNKTFAIDIKDILKHEKVLINIEYFELKGYEINKTNTMHLDYLKYVDTLIERKCNGA